MTAGKYSPKQLSQAILRYLLDREHAQTGTWPELDELVRALESPNEEIRDQLDILEDQGAIKANRTLGGHYYSMITGRGKALLQQLEEQDTISYEPEPQQASSDLTPEDTFEWDAFICHASEDKLSFVQQLALRLTDEGVSVWYDDFTLQVGDSLPRSIENGLAKSRYGIVILSAAFFEKEWPQRELDGLAVRQRRGKKVILPIWLGIGQKEIRSRAPSLAASFALRADKGMDTVVTELLRVLKRTPSALTDVNTPTMPANWIEAYDKQHGSLPPVPDYLLEAVNRYSPGQPVSKSIEVVSASAQLWNRLLPSQQKELLDLAEWSGWARGDYEAKMRKLWPREVRLPPPKWRPHRHSGE